ncbi:MAG TPA: hypothetical protein VFF57_02055 [Hanamia sp.]|nr:hypothetical protein [Hanamia sp.]
MKRLYHCLFIFFFLLFFTQHPLWAQGGPGGGNPGDPGCDPDDPYCPIDGGLTVLIIFGAGYGVIRYVLLNKQAKDPGHGLKDAIS